MKLSRNRTAKSFKNPRAQKYRSSKDSRSRSLSKKKKIKPEEAHKKLHVPSRLRREPFKNLMMARQQPTLTNDVTAAIGLKKLGNSSKSWLKIDLPGDFMNAPAYKVRMPENFTTTIFAPPVTKNQDLIYYLYNTYNFLDDLSKYEIFKRAVYCATMIPKKGNALEESLLIGITMCASADLRRRREMFRIAGNPRPSYSNFGTRIMESARCLIAKSEKHSHPFFSHLITEQKEDVKEFTSSAISSLNDDLQSDPGGITKNIIRFVKRNRKWVQDRMSCKKIPIFLKFPRKCLQDNVVNHHPKMSYRTRVDQDLLSEFNYFPSHLSFSVHFCRVIKNFTVNKVKEDAIITKALNKKQPFLRVRMTRYSNFPAVSIVNFNANDELQLALPRIPKRANTIAAFSGYSSDSALSVATDTPLDWEHNWHFTDKLKEHRMCNTGDMTRGASRLAADRYMIERKLKELIRRKHLLLKEDRRFELQDTVPIFEKLEKMHPPLIYCRLKGMELRKLRRSVDPSLREDMDKSKNARTATSYLFRKRIEFLEKTLPCRNDPRILLTHGWKVFAKRENPENFKNVAKILRQRSAWVSKNCLSRSATVPRCDKLPQNEGVKYKKYFLVLLFLLTCFLVMATMSMMSYL